MTMDFNFSDALKNTLSHETGVREQATAQLDKLQVDNFANYLLLLTQALLSASNDFTVRQTAGLLIKNALSAKDSLLQHHYSKRWTDLQVDVKAQLKQNLLAALNTDNLQAALTAAQAITAVASIELPRGEWPDLIPGLLQSCSLPSPIAKQTSLTTIGYICENIDPTILAPQSNQILTAVAQGAQKSEENLGVRVAAVRALYNSLEFVRDNFENEGERNYIMQIICEGTQSPSSDLSIVSYECLVKCVSIYYDKMGHYMEKALFGLTINGMKSEDDGVALQAIEFWSSVCEEECELRAIALEAFECGETPTRHSQNFALGALNELVPTLLYLLTKQEEDVDDDEWTVSMSAATSLALLAQTVQDAIVQPTLVFVESNIKSPDWKGREAAVMAFGSILEGPSEGMLGPLVDSAFGILIEMMTTDPSEAVKDTVAWTLGRVCELLPQCAFNPTQLQKLIHALIHGLNEPSSRVAFNSCWALVNLAEQADPGDQYQLTAYFQGVVEELMRVAEKPGMTSQFRGSAYEAISAFVTTAPKGCYEVVERLTMGVLERLRNSVGQQDQVVGMDDRNALLELQANLCSVLTAVIRKMSSKISVLADAMMETLLAIMSGQHGKSSTVMEDAFLTVGAITTAVDGEFLRYMERFLPILLGALNNFEEHTLCSIAVGIVGDICRALNEQVIPFTETIMTALLSILQSNVLQRSVKPVILSCFGDIALACGGTFENYMTYTMGVLEQAAQSSILDPGVTDYGLLDYSAFLREGIVEAYVGIVQGIKGGQNAACLTPYIPQMFHFLQLVSTDAESTEATYRGALGLMGDLAETFPTGQLSQFYNEPWVVGFLKVSKSQARELPGSTRDVLKWVKEVVKRQQQSEESKYPPLHTIIS